MKRTGEIPGRIFRFAFRGSKVFSVVYVTALIGLFSPALLSAQIKFLRFVPGNFRFDNFHRVEIQNTGTAEISLSGYLLVTREYSVLLPSYARIPAGGTIAFVKQKSAGETAKVIELIRLQDFLIRIPDRRYEGSYAVLISPKNQIVDAFYTSPSRDVPFLPDSDTCVTSSNKKIPFILPPEKGSVWQYTQSRDDPAIAFERTATGWGILSRSRLLKPPVEYRNLTARFRDGIMTLTWSTAFENQIKEHIVERSTDQLTFSEAGRVLAAGGSAMNQYEFLEPLPADGKVYYYRIRNADKAGVEVNSPVRACTAREGLEDFFMEVLPGLGSDPGLLSIRFSTAYSERIRIKIMDAQWREIALLFDGFVNAKERRLLRMQEALVPGSYRILAETESRRYVQEWSVE